MKCEWTTITASKYCARVTDGTHDSPKAQNQGRKLITSKHLKGNFIDFESANWISEADYQKIIERSKVEQWDILYSMIGTIGTTYLETNATVDYACKNMGIFKFGGDKQKALWMYYFLKSPKANEYIHAVLRGSTQSYVPLGALRDLPILVPPEGERDAIIGILHCLDEKIEKNERVNDNLQQQAQALFDYFFPYAPTDNLPNDWRSCLLAEVSENIRTRVKNRKCTVLSAVNTGRLQPSEEYFTKQVFSKDISNYIVVEENDFAYNPARVNIGSIGINDLRLTGCVSPVYVVFRVEKDYQYFFDFFIKTSRFREEVKTRASGSVRQAMNYSDFALIPIVYPPKTTIDEFNRLYLPIRNHIEHRKAENDRLAEMRDALLPKLMSGEIDVSDAKF